MNLKQLHYRGELKKLGEVCEVKKGDLITKKTTNDGDIPVIAGGQSPAYYHNKSNRDGETITVSGSGAYAGFVNFFNYPIFASDCTTIKSNNEKEILTKYVYYYLINHQEEIYQFQTGSGQPHVYPKNLAKIEIPIIPTDLQKRIVDFLDNISIIKTRRKKNNNNTEKIVQSIFAEMFGDPTKNNKKYPIEVLNDVTEKITDGTHITPNYVKEGIPFLRVTDITNSNDSKKYITREEHQELTKRCKPEKGDILYTKNGTIGIAKTIDWDYDFSIFVSLCLIKPKKDKILPKYLEVFLNTPFALAQAMQHSKKGTITNLHLIEIKKIKVPIPPISKQKEFLDIVEKVERIIKHQNNSTLEINNLSESLMQQAFNGDLK